MRLNPKPGPQRPKCIVLFCAHPINDPLIALLVLDYFKKIQQERNDTDIILFTEERAIQDLATDLRSQLIQLRIIWYPLIYDLRKKQWIQKLKNIFHLWYRTGRAVSKYSDRYLIGFLSMAGGYAALLGLFIRSCSITICFEPHSRYMLELGIWRKWSLKYLVVDLFERLQMWSSSHLIVPTGAVLTLTEDFGRRRPTHLLPITIDVDKAIYQDHARQRLRAEYQWEGRTVLVYTGKFNGIYYSHEDYLQFMVRVRAVDPDIKFLIITSDQDVDELHSMLKDHPLCDDVTLKGAMPAKEMTYWLSASDLGVIGIPPTPSQVYRTPVKTAFYWASGLPLIIPYGVSDDHIIAAAEDVGIVVDDLPKVDPVAFLDELSRYRRMDQKALRQRCIQAAKKYRDTSRMVDLLGQIIDQRTTGSTEIG